MMATRGGTFFGIDWMPRRVAAMVSILALVASLVGVVAASEPAGASTDPSVTVFSMSTTSVNTTSAAATIRVTAHITSTYTFYDGYFDFYSPSEDQDVEAYFSSSNRISGSTTDGTYQTTMTVPAGSEAGTWEMLDGYVEDTYYARSYGYSDFVNAGFPASFTNTGTADTTAPALVSFSMSPTSISTGQSSASITVTARITDNASGFNYGYFYFDSPSGNYDVEAYFSSSNRSSGSSLDGTYQTTMNLAQGSEPGVWSLDYGYVYDQISNDRYYGYSDFTNAGFAASFTNAGVPGAPTNVSATAGNQSASVSWTAPASNGSSISSYTVTASPGPASVTVSGSQTNATVAGLNNGTSYTFTVKATNGAGTGPSSTSSNAVTPAAVPGAPTNASATAGNASASVSWTAPASNGSSISSYTVTASPGASSASVSGSQTNATVAGLTNGTSYTFTVTATNGAGTGPSSAPSNAVTPAGPPGAPTNASATAGNQSASVSWTAPASNGSSISSYTVSASPGPASVTVAATQTSATVAGLTNGTSYTFTVTATNGVGTGPASSPSNAVVPGGSGPAIEAPSTGFAAPLATIGAVTVPVVEKWAAASDPNGICGYDLRESIAGGSFNQVTLPSQTSTSVGLSLNPNTSYRFEVNVTNCIGQSSGFGVQPSFAPLVWQESNKRIKYSGTWTTNSQTGASGGALKDSIVKGASATESFQGTGVAWVSETGPTRGKATVYLDGVKQKTIDLYSPTVQKGQIVWKQGYTTQAQHTIEIVVAGTPGRARVDLDAILTLHLQ